VDVVGTAVQAAQGRWIVPLPHPSGASLWLNKPEHQVLVQRAIEYLRGLNQGMNPNPTQQRRINQC
jgi:hypothetical protein